MNITSFNITSTTLYLVSYGITTGSRLAEVADSDDIDSRITIQYVVAMICMMYKAIKSHKVSDIVSF